MKKIILALVLLLAPNLSWAQCNGSFPPNTYCGNNSGTNSPPFPISGSTSVYAPSLTASGDIAYWISSVAPDLGDSNTITINMSQATVNNRLNLTGAPSVQALHLNQAFTYTSTQYATPIFLIVNPSGTTSSSAPFMYEIGNSADNLNSSVGYSIGYSQDALGNFAVGDRDAFEGNIYVTATTSNPNTAFYTPLGGLFVGEAPDSGSGVGGNTVAELLTGATGYNNLEAIEPDVLIQAGASAFSKVGIENVLLATDRTQGSIIDAGTLDEAGDTGTPGWKILHQLGSPYAYWPCGGSAGSPSTCWLNGTAPPLSTQEYTAAGFFDYSHIICSVDY